MLRSQPLWSGCKKCLMWNWTSRTETNLQTADSAFCCHNITTSCFIFTDEESRLTPDSSGLLWRNWWRQTAMRWVSPTSTALTDGCSGFSKTYTFNFSSIASLSTSLNPEISRIQSVRASVCLSASDCWQISLLELNLNRVTQQGVSRKTSSSRSHFSPR